jgi:para-nitrobenzyl esterase
MVWIHGGSLTSGTPGLPVYDGTELARKGVVVVNIAYRLGAFGFLFHPALREELGHLAANLGLQDQIAALKWVQEHISQLGGDPNNVTILGESAGGWSVSILASSPKARGLFHRAIAQSGVVVSPSRKSNRSLRPFENLIARPIAERNGTVLFSSLEVASLREARGKSTAEILSAASATMFESLPVVDGELMPDEIAANYAALQFNDVPLLLGYNSGEGIGNVPPGVTSEALIAASRNMALPCSAESVELLALYPHSTDVEAVSMIEESQRDGDYGWSAWSLARLQSKYGRAKVYLYYFDIRPPASPKGAPHFEEVAYVFGTQSRRYSPWSVVLQNHWVNFAKFGNPNDLETNEWPAFDATSPEAKVFHDGHSSVMSLPNLKRVETFDKLFTCLGMAQMAN